MGNHEEETNTSLGGYNEEKGMAKNRDYRLPAFSLDKRIRSLEVGARKTSTGKAELNKCSTRPSKFVYILEMGILRKLIFKSRFSQVRTTTVGK